MKIDFLKKIKITQKISGSFAVILILVSIMAVFSFLNLDHIKSMMIKYETQSKESFLISGLNNDLVNARMATYTYRLDAAPEYAAQVRAALDNSLNRKEDVLALVKDKNHLDLIAGLNQSLESYKDVFSKTVDLQNRQNELLGDMKEFALSSKAAFQDVIDSAYQGNNISLSKFAGQAQAHLLRAQIYEQNFFSHFHEQDEKQFHSELNMAKSALSSLQRQIQNPELRQKTNIVQDGLGQYRANFEEAKTVALQKEKLHSENLDQIAAQLMTGYKDLAADVQQKQIGLKEAILSDIARMRTSNIAVSMVIFIFAVTIAFLISRFLVQNFRLIISQMERLSKGDKSFEIRGADRGDEIGEMATALQIFRENALEVERLEAEQKAAEQKAAADRKAATLKMADDFETRVGKIVQIVEKAASDMQGMASVLAAAIEETTHQSSSVAAASQQASTNVQTVASAAEELSTSIREIAASISDTATTARNCAGSAKMSQEKLTELQHAVGEIDSVIQSINDVAEQTNLLALNATIEAARAGEAGKGFAVVASEVKSLANETHKMTEEIARKVEEIKRSANDTISSVSDILNQITSVDQKTTTVASAVEQQNSATSEISRNVQEAATGTAEVSRNIEQVQQAANDSATSTEQLKGASDSLAQEASNLKKAVDSFLAEVRAA